MFAVFHNQSSPLTMLFFLKIGQKLSIICMRLKTELKEFNLTFITKGTTRAQSLRKPGYNRICVFSSKLERDASGVIVLDINYLINLSMQLGRSVPTALKFLHKPEIKLVGRTCGKSAQNTNWSDVSIFLRTTWFKYQLTKQNGLVCSLGPRDLIFKHFDLNIWFSARKVIGTFEKRASGPGCMKT